MGRKSKYNEPSVTIGVRVPESLKEQLKQPVDVFIEDYLKIAGYYGISKEDALKPVELSTFNNCGCQLLGNSTTGKPIYKYCKKHKPKLLWNQ